jgi:hypothetical protein
MLFPGRTVAYESKGFRILRVGRTTGALRFPRRYYRQVCIHEEVV